MNHLIKCYRSVQLRRSSRLRLVADKWLHKIKFDGYRLLGLFDHKQAKLLMCNGNDWTDRFPSIRASMAQLKAEFAVLDVEAVIVERWAKQLAHSLQKALGTSGKNAPSTDKL
jgi:bifunctional non-homologous end joining protein LigD